LEKGGRERFIADDIGIERGTTLQKREKEKVSCEGKKGNIVSRIKGKKKKTAFFEGKSARLR